MWSEFTTSGAPSSSDEPQWERWEGGVAEGRSYLFGDASSGGLGMAPEAYEQEKRRDCPFWEKFGPRPWGR